MTLTLDKFLERHGTDIEAAIELGEYDKGISLVENLFLIESLDEKARIVCATLGMLCVGRKFREVILQSTKMQASMGLSEEEKEQVRFALSNIGKVQKDFVDLTQEGEQNG